MRILQILVLSGLIACAEAPIQVPSYPALAREKAQVSGAPKAQPKADALSAYRPLASKIRLAAMGDTDAFNRLAELCDGIGARPSGSKPLDQALAWAKAHLERDGQENVRIEPVKVPGWDRGSLTLQLVAPRARALNALALGHSVGTPKQGIEADVVVVQSRDELDALGGAVKGKVVLFNAVMPPFDQASGDPGYGAVIWARLHGASLAAKHGAVAVLVRSLTAHSLNSPHTGTLIYAEDTPQIPAVAVTTEDAAYIARMSQAKANVRIRLNLSARSLGEVPSGNVVAELRGREKPEEVVLIGAHIDSWDVGQGAHDDGAGVVITMQALRLLRALQLTPKRTIRVVLFTNEESGGRGAEEYARTHKDEKHLFAIETDTGGTRTVGFGVDSEDDTREGALRDQLAPVADILAPLAATQLIAGFGGADVTPLRKQGAIAMSQLHEISHYFDLHHSDADTLDKIDPEELKQSVAALATMAYLLADLDDPPH